MGILAGVQPIQDNACAGHIPPPFRVAQLRGRIGAVHRAGGIAIRLQAVHHAGKQVVLLLCIGQVIRCIAVCHGKMLEDAADRKARQSIQRLDLTDGLLETRAYRKADAAHTGVDFNMNLYPHPGLHSSGRKRLGVLRGEAGGGNIILRQRCSVGRVGITQDQDGYRNAMVAQMMPLAQAAYRKTGNACLLYRLGGGYVTVAVGIGLDNGADWPAGLMYAKLWRSASRSISAQQCFSNFISIHPFIAYSPCPTL